MGTKSNDMTPQTGLLAFLERRMAALRDLGAALAGVKTAEEACAVAAEILSGHEQNLPFVLLYFLDSANKKVRLAGAGGLAGAAWQGPETISLEAEQPVWPLAEVLRTETAQIVQKLPPFLEGAGFDQPQQALVVPIHSNRSGPPEGFLVGGMVAQPELAGVERSFFELAAGQIAGALAAAESAQQEQKRAGALLEMNRELQKSEERYRAIVEGQAEMVCRFRPDGTILFVNGAYARARGTSPEALSEANFWDFIDEADRPGVRAMLHVLRPEAPTIRIENRFETTEGARWTLWTNRGLAFGADGQPLEVQSAGIDITDRKEAEEALRESEAKLSAIVQELPVGVGITDGEGRTLSLNPAGLRLHGFASLEEMFVHFEQYREEFELHYPDGRLMPFSEWPLTRALRGEYVHDYQVGLRRHPDGAEKIVSFSAVPLPAGHAGSDRLVFVMHDITGRKKSEERYRALFETIGEGFCIFEMIYDSDGNPVDYRWLETNPAFERHTGLLSAVGKTARELVPGLEQHWVEIYGRVARTGKPERFIEQSVAMGRWFEVDAFRLGAPEERTVGLLFMDISERKQAEEKLRQLNETLEERVEQRTQQVRELVRRLTMAEQEERRRISQILHDDLQQILYAIEMKMSMLPPPAGKEEPTGLDAHLAATRDWIDQAVTMTRQLTVDLSPPILHNEGLADALEWLQRQMHDLHGLEVTIEAEHSFYLPDADLRVLLFQIVRELLFNVKKHAGVREATVRLVESQEGGEAKGLVIYVCDQGRGFDVAEVLHDMEQAGGFGLFSVRERLNLLGGRLEIESEVGNGTQVKVQAPPQTGLLF